MYVSCYGLERQPNAALAWYWLQSRPYDPRLRRFLQPDPAKRGQLPDYTYANDDPLDVSDPSGQDGSAAQCGQQSYTNDPVQHARCNVAFLKYQQDESNNQVATGVAEGVAVGALSFVGGEVFAGALTAGVLGSLVEGSALRIGVSVASGAAFNAFGAEVAGAVSGTPPEPAQLGLALVLGAGEGAFVGYASELADAVAQTRNLSIIEKQAVITRWTTQASALGNVLQQEATNLFNGKPFDPGSLATAAVYGYLGGLAGGTIGKLVGSGLGFTSAASAIGIRAALDDPSLSGAEALGQIKTSIVIGSLVGSNVLSNAITDLVRAGYPSLAF